MQSSVGSTDVAVLVMVAGKSIVPFRGRVHENVLPNGRLRPEWVQGCSCPHRVCIPNGSDWTKREQEEIARRCHVLRVGDAQMSGLE